MHRNTALALYFVLMVAIIVAVDVLFLRHRFGVRLAVNAGIALVFVLLYFAALSKD